MTQKENLKHEEEHNEAVETPVEETTEETAETTSQDEAVQQEPTPEEESLRDQFVRLQADFTNFRNRVQRERSELYQRANEDLFLEMLSVLDHFEMGLQTAEQHQTEGAVLDGFKMVYDQFQNVLKKFNLEVIDAVGETFDPHRHEALTHMPSDEYPEEVCSQQIRKGYLFGEKLLRPAQVVVSSGPAKTEA